MCEEHRIKTFGGDWIVLRETRNYHSRGRNTPRNLSMENFSENWRPVTRWDLNKELQFRFLSQLNYFPKNVQVGTCRMSVPNILLHNILIWYTNNNLLNCLKKYVFYTLRISKVSLNKFLISWISSARTKFKFDIFFICRILGLCYYNTCTDNYLHYRF